MNETKLIAKCAATGLYFDGTAFNESDRSKAKTFSTKTDASDFRLMGWAAPVVMEPSEADVERYVNATPEQRQREQIDKARRHITVSRAKSFTVFSPRDGKYFTRRMYVPERSFDPAFCKIGGWSCAVLWKNGELCLF